MNDINAYYALIFRDLKNQENLICRYEVNDEGKIYLNAPNILDDSVEDPGPLEPNDLWFIEFCKNREGKWDVQYTVDMEVTNELGQTTAEFLAMHANNDTIQEAAANLFATCLMQIKKMRVIN